MLCVLNPLAQRDPTPGDSVLRECQCSGLRSGAFETRRELKAGHRDPGPGDGDGDWVALVRLIALGDASDQDPPDAVV
jgi:hypothetical protein